jgi:hypothetical protein
MEEATQIPVKVSTRTLLRKLGEKGQTYDEIILRLIDFWRKGHEGKHPV